MSGDRRAICEPIDGVGIEQQLPAPWRRVIEDGHLAITDDNEPVFLEWVEPTHKHVGATLTEAKRHHRYVRHLLAEKCTAIAGDMAWKSIEDAQEQSDVVRSKAP